MKKIFAVSLLAISLLLPVASASINAQSIEYNPNSAPLVLDAQVERVLRHFPKEGTPPMRPYIGAKLENNENVWTLVFYKEPDESNRLEIRFPDLTTNDEATRLLAHKKAVDLLEKLAPRYFERVVNLVLVEDAEFVYSFR